MANRKDERSKRQKLDQIYLALRDHHEGLTQSELADTVDVGRWDINRYLKRGDLVRMSFDRDEITMMHVAMRFVCPTHVGMSCTDRWRNARTIKQN